MKIAAAVCIKIILGDTIMRTLYSHLPLLHSLFYNPVQTYHFGHEEKLLMGDLVLVTC